MTKGYSQTIVWNGIEYPSIRYAAKCYGISYFAMRTRIQSGHSCDDDLSGGRKYIQKPITIPLPKRGGPGRPITWNGKEYNSVTNAAIDIGIKFGTLYGYVQLGYVCDDDLFSRNIMWNGISYKNMAAAARFCEITREAMRLRIKKGYTCDENVKSLGRPRQDIIS